MSLAGVPAGLTEKPIRSAADSARSAPEVRPGVAAAYFGPAGGDTRPVAISPLNMATAPHCLLGILFFKLREKSGKTPSAAAPDRTTAWR
jgi:hypothetical protein